MISAGSGPVPTQLFHTLELMYQERKAQSFAMGSKGGDLQMNLNYFK
jgi:hypothetical protein